MRFRQVLRNGIYLAALGSAIMARAQSPDEQRLVDLTNEARAEGGLKPVVWDANLAAAAKAHCQRMAQEDSILHRYPGEADLGERAAKAGARFSEIAENIAMGTSPGQIHGAWMNSKDHHDNLMNANVDHIGVSLIPARGALYAVVDFAQSVAQMTPPQVESKVGAAIVARAKSMAIDADAGGARKYCALADGEPATGLGLQARFLMRWQRADIATLPPELEKALASGQYTHAAVGACEAKASAAGPVFTVYRVAVLLY